MGDLELGPSRDHLTHVLEHVLAQEVLAVDPVTGLVEDQHHVGDLEHPEDHAPDLVEDQDLPEEDLAPQEDPGQDLVLMRWMVKGYMLLILTVMLLNVIWKRSSQNMDH